MTQAVVVHPCGRCGSTRLWNVRELKESEGPLAVAYQVHEFDHGRYDSLSFYTLNRFGSYELLVCAGCGHLEWFARHFDPDPDVPGVSTCYVDCAWCATKTVGWRVETAEELVGGISIDVHKPPPTKPLFLYLFMAGGGMGRFSVTVCGRCGHSVWTGYDLGLQPVPERGLSAVDGEPCRGCGDRARWRRSPLRESGTFSRPLAVAAKRVLGFFERRRGQIDVDVCRTCGWTEWTADTRSLEEGLDGLSLINVAEPAASGPEGPYR